MRAPVSSRLRVSPRIDLHKAFLGLSKNPLIVIDKMFDGFLHHRFGVASSLGGDACELDLHIQLKVHFQVRQSSTAIFCSSDD